MKWKRAALLALLAAWLPAGAQGVRPRVMVETDAGGDPDDEQSLVRLLLCANDLEITGILANRARARDAENRNPERTGTGIVHRLVNAYADCHPRLREHDPRYPAPDRLRAAVVDGTAESDAGVRAVIAAVDDPDERPLWFCNWGTDGGSAPSSLLRALDRVRAERGEAGYAAFKARLRLSSADKFGPHTADIPPAFPVWVDTFHPEMDGGRWYHRFSAVTAFAGGFNARADLAEGHGPLGALYPLNTRPVQKEGDTMTFLHLIPNGLNDPERPDWGGWSGRYGPRPDFPGRPYFWADQRDHWNATTHRDHTLARWAPDLQHDFQARLDWCVKPWAEANHPPVVRLRGGRDREIEPGKPVSVVARDSSDPDRGQSLLPRWFWYPEASGYAGPLPELTGRPGLEAVFTAPELAAGQSLHLVLALSDTGSPTLTRYARIVFRRPGG